MDSYVTLVCNEGCRQIARVIEKSEAHKIHFPWDKLLSWLDRLSTCRRFDAGDDLMASGKGRLMGLRGRIREQRGEQLAGQ